MICPRCNHENPEGAMDCSSCGIVFAKWAARQEREAARPPPAPLEPRLPPASTASPARPAPAPSRAYLVTGVALLGLTCSYWGCDQLTSEKQSSRAAPRAPEVAEREVPVREAPVGIDLAAGMSRLEPILRQIQQEAGAEGVTVSLNNLRHWFEKGAKRLHPAVAKHRASEVGLPPLEARRFDEADRERTKSQGGVVATKCSIDAKRVYSHSLPRKGPDEGVTECWKRQYGNRTDRGSSFETTFIGTWLDWWERYTWQPHNRRWAPYSESDDYRIMEHVIDTEYGFDAQAKDREESRERFASLRANSYLENDRRMRNDFAMIAVLVAYRTRIIREGALYRLQYERSR